MSIRAVVLAAALTASALVTVVAPASAAIQSSRFVAVTPERLLDTRDGTGVHVVGDHLLLDMTHRVVAGAAVVLNITGADANVDSFVTVWPDGQDRPNTSNLNVSRGQTAANLTTVELPPTQMPAPPNKFLDIWVHGDLGVIVDFVGYYSYQDGSGYLGHAPVRSLDTRTGAGPVGPNGTTVLDLSSKVPSTATAVVFNLTGTNTTAGTFVTAWPDGSDRPAVSSLNLAAGQTRANLVTVALPPSHKIDLYNLAGSVDLIADVAGVYVSEGGNSFYPLPPRRVIDTRDSAPVGPGGVVTVNTGQQASTVAVNITAVDATAPTFLTAWGPGTDPRPDSSTLNLGPGDIVPNMALVQTSGSSFSVYNLAGRVDVVVDLAGYFAA